MGKKPTVLSGPGVLMPQTPVDSGREVEKEIESKDLQSE
jgi:hypothetical protein